MNHNSKAWLSTKKRGRDDPVTAGHVAASTKHRRVIEGVFDGDVTEAGMRDLLTDAVVKADATAALEHVAASGRTAAAVKDVFVQPRWRGKGGKEGKGNGVVLDLPLFKFHLPVGEIGRRK